MKITIIKNFSIKFLKFTYKLFLTFGFDVKVLLDIKYYPLFLRNKKKWLRSGGKITNNHMILNDYNKSAGINKGHYFHQDLLVAQLIFQNKPSRHIDIGSRIDGFVSHVATFREIEVFDLRDLPNSAHPNIKFRKVNIMEHTKNIGLTDSLSCLHAIEHFGLGRYGDKIDVDGHKKGLENIIKLIKPNGLLYLSFPIGSKDEVHFNAHRIFHPMSILSYKNISEKIKLERFDYVDDNGELHINSKLENIPKNLKYGCGIYTFKVGS